MVANARFADTIVRKGGRQEKKSAFLHMLFVENERETIGDYVFLWNQRPHAKIELTWTSKKIYGLKSHLGYLGSYLGRHPFNSACK